LEETLLKKGFFQAIFPKLLKVLGNREPLWRGFKGKTLFQKGLPLNLMTLPQGSIPLIGDCMLTTKFNPILQIWLV
jgi:hypothetical protein